MGFLRGTGLWLARPGSVNGWAKARPDPFVHWGDLSSDVPLMTRPKKTAYASRGGVKLASALDRFAVVSTDRTCADLGCHAGGFVDVLLLRGARRVYAVDTGYGVLDYRLRRDPRVVVLERSNALHVELPETVSLITIDVGWTRQRLILPAARRLLSSDGEVVTLVKPHYEASGSRRRSPVLSSEDRQRVLAETVDAIRDLKWTILGQMESPLQGHAGNVEYLLHLRPAGET